MSFSIVETAFIGVLFAAGLILGITSLLTLWAGERLGLKNYMLKPIIVAGFIFAVSEAVLATSPFFLRDIGLEVHFLVETIAISTVIYGVILYCRNLVTATESQR